MNMEECKIQNLYTLENTIAEPFLKRYTYPWEALKNISDFIVELGNKLPKEDYIVKAQCLISALSQIIAGPLIYAVSAIFAVLEEMQ